MCRETPISGGLFWESTSQAESRAWGFPFLSEAAPHLGFLAKAQKYSFLTYWCTWPGIGWGGILGLPLSHLWF